MNSDFISKVVKFHRQEAGLTQFDLANLAGVGKTVIFDIEKGKTTIQLDTLFKVLSALNISWRLDSPLMEKLINHEKSINPNAQP